MKTVLKVILALLIAFFVLKGIIYLVNSKQPTDIDLSTIEINSFNAMFMSYEGTQKGSILKSLISNVDSENTEYNGTREISINFSGKNYKTSKELSELTSLISSSSIYEVTLEYDSNQLINSIQIVEQ